MATNDLCAALSKDIKIDEIYLEADAAVREVSGRQEPSIDARRASLATRPAANMLKAPVPVLVNKDKDELVQTHLIFCKLSAVEQLIVPLIKTVGKRPANDATGIRTVIIMG